MMLINFKLICAVIILLFVIYLIRYFWFAYRIDLKCKWIPSPKEYPIIRHAHLFRDMSDVVPVLTNLSHKFNGIYKLVIGPTVPAAFITDLETIKFILSSNKILDKSYVYMFLHRWLRFGLLTSTGEKWQQRRKLVTPTFHFQILEQFIEIFNNQSNILINRLKQHVSKDAFDIYPYVTLLTLDVICESAMGIKINAQINSDTKYVKSIKAMGDLIIRRAISPLKIHEIFYFFSLDHIKELLLLRTLHGTTRRVIKNRRKELKDLKKCVKEDLDDIIGLKKHSPFLDTLINSTINGKPLSDDEVREEVDTFMFEGHDTTSSGIGFVLYCLSTHADIQEKVFAELNSIFDGDKTRPITYKDLQDMKYLSMVIKESLRLFPPVPSIARLSTEDVYIDGKLYPAGLDLQILIIGLHRDERIYPEPLKFDPERFTSKNQSLRHPFAYIPFSAGPRNCIGQKFATLEIKLTVSNILRNYVLLPAEDYTPQLVNELILKSSNGIKLKLKNR